MADPPGPNRITRENTMTPDDVLAFWYDDAWRKLWFNSTPELDRELTLRFLSTWEAAKEGRLQNWESDPKGALALTIVLDQFPLNMFRDQPDSFSTEAAARGVASRAIDKGFDREMSEEERIFLYMPFMHSENLDDQETAVRLTRDIEKQRKWAEHHRNIIRRFGRFPHRNAILGRENTQDELDWLASPEAFSG